MTTCTDPTTPTAATIFDPVTAESTATPNELALAFIMGLEDWETGEYAKTLFPGNIYCSAMFHCYVGTVKDHNNPDRNPRSKPLCLWGEGGYGKTALWAQFCRTMQAWLSEKVAAPVTFTLYLCTLGGVNDFSEVMGIVCVDYNIFETKVAVTQNWPKPGALGIFQLDDFNRGFDQAINGGMEFANTMVYNGRALPHGFAIGMACNPANGDHKTRPLDKPQETRMMHLEYDPSHELFLENMVRQNIPAKALALFTKYPEIIQPPAGIGALSQPRPVNWRNSAMWAHLLASLLYDKATLIPLTKTTFGIDNFEEIMAVIEGEAPLGPLDVLGGTPLQRLGNAELLAPIDAWAIAAPVLASYHTSQRFDLTAATARRLVMHLNDPTREFSTEQIDNVGEFFLLINEYARETSLDSLRRLVTPNAPRAAYWLPKLNYWRSDDGETTGPLGQLLIDVNTRVRREIQQAVASAG